MKFKNEVLWNDGIKNNPDAYGARIYSYAQDWANMMEASMMGGKSIEQCAKETSRVANYDGITGYMYGAAVSILSKCWEHGEELRQWHNTDIQMRKRQINQVGY